VVKTIAGLPGQFCHAINIAINDREFEVTSRNTIILIFILASLDNIKDNVKESE
jgi:hypothetical protein